MADVVPRVREDRYGHVLEIQVIDEKGEITDLTLLAPDILEILRQRPDGSSFARTASFTTDGSDGRIRATVAKADLWSPSGAWRFLARFAKADDSFDFATEWIDVKVTAVPVPT